MADSIEAKTATPKFYQITPSEPLAWHVYIADLTKNQDEQKRISLLLSEIGDINPKRQDYAISRKNEEGKVVKFDTIDGAKLRESMALIIAFEYSSGLDEKGRRFYKDAIKSNPMYNKVKDKTTSQLIEDMPETNEESKNKLKGIAAKYINKPKEDQDALRNTLVNMTIVKYASIDVQGARLTLQEEARERKKNGQPPKDKPAGKSGDNPTSMLPSPDISLADLGMSNTDILAAAIEAGNVVNEATAAISPDKGTLPSKNAATKLTRKGGLAA
jgi:hypothetical protein